MKSIAAGKFKNVCLKTLDEVAATKTSIVITSSPPGKQALREAC